MKQQQNQHDPSNRAVFVRSASQDLRLARAGAGPILAFLPDWDAVDTLRAIAARAGLAARLTVHHHSAAPLVGPDSSKWALP